jgi:thiamine pyrophosphate-dependent acetolactate synthase large subunit-like protein
LAGAIGVKVAMPDRPVVAISGDGSAMYSIQALWTAAHHKLAIVFVVLANREYASFAERIGNCAAAGLRSGTALIVELFRWRRHCR